MTKTRGCRTLRATEWMGIAVLAAVVAVGAGCKPQPTGPAPHERAALARELEKLDAARAVPAPVAVEIYAARVIERFPASAEAAALRAELPALRAESVRWREQRRREQLWSYTAAEHARGYQLMAELSAEPAGAGPALRLVLRRHPQLGQAAYLTIGDGDDFACTQQCTLRMTFDQQPERTVALRRALDNVPPALFLHDHEAFFAALEAAGELRVEVPLASGDTVAYRFDVGGYVPQRMQGDGSPEHVGEVSRG